MSETMSETWVTTSTRRGWGAVMGGVLTLALAATAFAPLAPAHAFEPSRVECIAPASPGGGWDFTCRQAAKVFRSQSLAPGVMKVTNLAGAGGGVAYAEVVNKRNTDNNLIVAASSATATRLAQGAYPNSNASQVRWIGSIGADFGVVAVSTSSSFTNLKSLLTSVANNPARYAFAGGSAVGGWDHLKVLMLGQAVGIKNLRGLKYVAFDGGGEAITQLLGGRVQAFVGDVSEVKGFVDAGQLRVLAIMSPKRLSGDFAAFPTAKEQGVDAVAANWRGFYGPRNMSNDAYNYWVRAVTQMYNSAEWKASMRASGLSELGYQGKEFETFVSGSIEQIAQLSKDVGLIK